MTYPTIAGTGLQPAEYLDFFAAEVAAIEALDLDLARDVPSCPGWTVRDALSHLIGVYRSKIVAIETGEEPTAPEQEWGYVADSDDIVAVFHQTYERLFALLQADPASPSWTWWPPDQTVGFWQRRMAHETSVHRWDIEQALVADPTPIDAVLAADGVDELLGWMRWPWDFDPQESADGHTVAVATDAHAWTLSIHPVEIFVEAGDHDPQAWVRGGASDVLLRLWGRPIDDSTLDIGGDPHALSLLRKRLSQAAD